MGCQGTSPAHTVRGALKKKTREAICSQDTPVCRYLDSYRHSNTFAYIHNIHAYVYIYTYTQFALPFGMAGRGEEVLSLRAVLESEGSL